MLRTIAPIFIFLASFNAVSQERKDISSIENNLSDKIHVEGKKKKTYSISQRMKAYKVPGVSIAIAKDGKLVYAKGFGIANSELKTEVNSHTLFQAASISKPFAALAVLKLVEQGKVDLDIDVNTYLKTWKIPENKFTATEKVTLRRLLNHTAGITVHGFPGYKQAENFPTTIDVLDGKGNTPAVIVDTIPGSMWRYSGGGYTIIQQIVYDISGMTLDEFSGKFIFPEMGLLESTFQQPLAGDKMELASGAYDQQGKLYEGAWHNYPEIAAAGLWTTPSDLVKYCLHIQNIYAGKASGLLTKETVQQMLTRYKNDYGLGVGLMKEGDSLLFGHNGKNAGFTNLMLAFANQGDAIVVMTNGDNGSVIMEEILRAASEFYDWKIARNETIKPVVLKKTDLKKFTGRYFYEMGGEKIYIESKIKKGKVVLYDPDSPSPIRLTPMSDLEFIDVEHKIKIDFILNEKGEVVSLLWDKQWIVEKAD